MIDERGIGLQLRAGKFLYSETRHLAFKKLTQIVNVYKAIVASLVPIL